MGAPVAPDYVPGVGLPTHPSAASLLCWGRALDSWDEVDPALEILTSAAMPGETRHERARLLLEQGDPRRALAVLDDGQHPGLPPDDFTMDDVLRAGCHASMGHAGAYAWLRSVTVAAQGAVPVVYIRWIVALAADSFGDTDTADQMWLSLVSDSGLLTGPSVARFTVVHASAARREAIAGGKIRKSAALYLRLADNLEQLPNPLDRDPRPIISAVRMLRERGEAQAALMLLTAAANGAPPNPAIAEAYERAAPTRPGMTPWTRAATIAVGTVVGLLVGIGLVGLVLTVAGIAAWRNFIPIRGWTLADSRIFRSLRAVQYDPVSRGHRVQGGESADGPRLLWMLLGLALGSLVIGPLLATSIPSGLGSDLGGTLWLGSSLAGGFLGYQWGLRKTHHLIAVGPSLVAPTCRCATTPMLAGSAADDYAARHLTPTASTAVTAGSTVLTCPALGLPWLRVPVNTDGAVYLLRGIATRVDAGLPGQDSATSGFYL